MEHLASLIKDMKSVAEFLIPHTHPNVDYLHEKDVLPLKQRVINIDGYDLSVCFSKSDYQTYFMESLQIQSLRGPFLPFCLVCTLGIECFGLKNLSFLEFFKNNKKVYCWTVKTLDGEVLPPDEGSLKVEFEGFEYNILPEGAVELY